MSSCAAAVGVLRNRHDADGIEERLRADFARLGTQVLGMQEFIGWARLP